MIDSLLKSDFVAKMAETEWVKKNITSRNITLQLQLHSVKGTLTLNFPPAPSDRIWQVKLIFVSNIALTVSQCPGGRVSQHVGVSKGVGCNTGTSLPFGSYWTFSFSSFRYGFRYPPDMEIALRPCFGGQSLGKYEGTLSAVMRHLVKRLKQEFMKVRPGFHFLPFFVEKEEGFSR